MALTNVSQLPPVGDFWRAAVIIAIAIMAMIVAYNFISPLLSSFDFSSGSGGGKCPVFAKCGEMGMGVTVAPGCKCPSSCKSQFTITNPPSMKGYIQCSP